MSSGGQPLQHARHGGWKSWSRANRMRYQSSAGDGVDISLFTSARGSGDQFRVGKYCESGSCHLGEAHANGYYVDLSCITCEIITIAKYAHAEPHYRDRIRESFKFKSGCRALHLPSNNCIESELLLY